MMVKRRRVVKAKPIALTVRAARQRACDGRIEIQEVKNKLIGHEMIKDLDVALT